MSEKVVNGGTAAVATRAENPFATKRVLEGESLAVEARVGNASVDAARQREQAEVQAMILLAKRFPRDQKAAMDRIINACARPTLAEGAVYTYSRGGTDIQGPSIRLAEAIAQSWGNLQFGIREIEQRAGESTVEAFAWDLETNTRQSKVFQVSHVRHTKQGAKMLTDPRDIYEMVANNGARRVRACILGLIPGDVVDAALAQCDVTLKSSQGEVTPERIKGMLEKFSQFGVTREQIEKRIQRRIDSITPAQLVNLGKVFNSLRDGMSSPADWFEAAVPAEAGTEAKAAAKTGADKLAEKLGVKNVKPTAKAAPAPAEDGGLSEDEKREIEEREADEARKASGKLL